MNVRSRSRSLVGARHAAPLLMILWMGGGLDPVSLSAQALSEINSGWLERQEKAMEWGRDPFSLPGQPAGAIGTDADGEFHLSAIIYRAGRGVAIINNRILRTGDTIKGQRIAEILEDRVVLHGSAGRKELKVNQFLLDR